MPQTIQKPSPPSPDGREETPLLYDNLTYPFKEKPQAGDVREVARGLFWLRMPLPFGLDHINLWALEEKESWTIVDTGTNTPEIRAVWDSFWKTRGKGKPLRRMMVTHLHPDHVGLAGWIAEKWGAKLFMSRTDYLMCRMLAGDTGRAVPKDALDFYHAAGFEDKHTLAYMKLFGGFGKYISPLPDSFGRIQDRQILHFGEREWEAVVGRGHAPEHVCFYCKEDDLLISGDQVLPRITSNVSVFPTEPEANPLAEWIDSCRHFKERIPDSVFVLPAHNEPFYGLHKRLDDMVERHETALERLRQACERERQRAIDVFPELFARKVDSSAYMMAVGESVAHLNCLRARGLVEVERDEDNVNWYRAIPKAKGEA